MIPTHPQLPRTHMVHGLDMAYVVRSVIKAHPNATFTAGFNGADCWLQANLPTGLPEVRVSWHKRSCYVQHGPDTHAFVLEDLGVARVVQAERATQMRMAARAWTASDDARTAQESDGRWTFSDGPHLAYKGSDPSAVVTALALWGLEVEL